MSIAANCRPANLYGWNPSNVIHPTAVIHPKTKLGKGNYFGPGVIVYEGVTIGDNNTFVGNSAIGSPAEHRGVDQRLPIAGTVIGNGNTIREFVTINAPTKEESKTEVGDGCWLLRGSHVGHDAFIGDEVTLSCDVLVGGHAKVGSGANLGLGAIVHQFCVIGHGAMVGMGTVVTKKTPIKPFNKYAGVPARELGPNNHAVDKTPVEVAMAYQNEYCVWVSP